ncbi:MAG TPA: hypothetical protein PKD90_08150 [Phnomibacter sp.]|nr:hypothetical protein [Phnomibacter sp.]
MAFVTTTQAAEALPTPQSQSTPGADASLLLMGALAGAALSKEAQKQSRKMMRKLAWKALGDKLKGMFSKKHRRESEIAGMPLWLFLLLVIAAAAIGLWLFGLLGFLILLGLGAIIYLLLNSN